MSPRFDRRARAIRVAGGLIFVACTVQYALAQVIAASAWHPPYSWTANFISDLGNTACGRFAVPHGSASYVCSPDHALMNISFVVSGVLTIAGTLLLWQVWPVRRMTTVALSLWLVAGALKVVVGLVPENVNVSLHLLGAFNLPLESVAILLLSLALRTDHRSFASFGMAMAVIGIAGTVFTTGAQYAGGALNLGLGNGGMERIAAYPGNIWMVAAGVAAMATLRPRPAVGDLKRSDAHRARLTARPGYQGG